MTNAELIVTAVGSPAILGVVMSVVNYFIRKSEARISAALRAEEKKQEWARQDEVAERVELTRKLLVATNQENTGLLTHLTKTTESTHKIVNNRTTLLLKSIATLWERIARENPKDKHAQRAAKDAREAVASAEKVQSE